MAPRQRSPAPVVEDPSEAAALIATKDDIKKRIVRRQESTAEDDILATEIAVAREQHDLFNLAALLPMIFFTLLNFHWGKIRQGEFGHAWNGDYFSHCWSATLIYFIVDLIWVASIPRCVKSPNTIVFHHFVAITYLIAPIVFPDFRWFMGAVLSVEINTWFLIARRVVYKRGLRPENIDSKKHKLLMEVVSGCFYTTWVVIRCMVYPGILLIFLHMAYVAILETGIFFHWPMIFLPIHTFLVVLNLKWTYDLFKPLVRDWWKSLLLLLTPPTTRTSSPSMNHVSSGL